MQTTLALLAISCSVALAGYGYGTAGSSSASNEVYSHGPSCVRRYIPTATCGCEPRVVKHCPKVSVKHRRFVVNHPQKVKKVTQKITLHKHVVRRLPKVFKKVVVKNKVRYGLRKLPTCGCGCGNEVYPNYHPTGKYGSSSSEERLAPRCASINHPVGCGCAAVSSSEEFAAPPCASRFHPVGCGCGTAASSSEELASPVCESRFHPVDCGCSSSGVSY